MTERPLSGTEKRIVSYIHRHTGVIRSQIVDYLVQTDPEWSSVEDPQEPFVHLVVIGYIECIKIPSSARNEYYLTPQGVMFAEQQA